ncbi:MAG: hypothetical protein QHH43_06115 [Candidatus Saccharicenans sp.]|nr:hypothetical protein [Candidatus Saccharicenans sp.]MDH7575315.1 hypothetical protein [Candidatus Saccharicenans sp.]
MRVAENGLVTLAIILATFIVLWQPARATFCNRSYEEDPGGRRLQSAGSLRQDWAIPDYGPDGLKGLTEEQKKKILSGEVVLVSSHEGVPEGKSIISAALVFEVPVERAWAILSAPELQAEYLEEIEELKTVEQGPGFNRMFFLVKVMGQKVRYTVIHHFWPDQFYLWWELDRSQPHDLKDLYGFWKLFRYDERRTVARYGTFVRPAFPVPAFLRNWLSRSNVRHSLATVKNYVEGRK